MLKVTMTTPRPDLSLLRSTKCKNESTSIVFPDTFFFHFKDRGCCVKNCCHGYCSSEPHHASKSWVWSPNPNRLQTQRTKPCFYSNSKAGVLNNPFLLSLFWSKKMFCISMSTTEASSWLNGFKLCLCLFTDPNDVRRHWWGGNKHFWTPVKIISFEWISMTEMGENTKCKKQNHPSKLLT